MVEEELPATLESYGQSRAYDSWCLAHSLEFPRRMRKRIPNPNCNQPFLMPKHRGILNFVQNDMNSVPASRQRREKDCGYPPFPINSVVRHPRQPKALRRG